MPFSGWYDEVFWGWLIQSEGISPDRRELFGPCSANCQKNAGPAWNVSSGSPAILTTSHLNNKTRHAQGQSIQSATDINLAQHLHYGQPIRSVAQTPYNDAETFAEFMIVIFPLRVPVHVKRSVTKSPTRLVVVTGPLDVLMSVECKSVPMISAFPW